MMNLRCSSFLGNYRFRNKKAGSILSTLRLNLHQRELILYHTSLHIFQPAVFVYYAGQPGGLVYKPV